MGLLLLPGERIDVELRPHPLGFMPRYLVAALFGLWGAFLWWMYHTPWWAGHDGGPWYLFWTYLYGNDAMAYLYALVGLAALGALVALAVARWRFLVGFVAVGVLLMAINLFGFRQDPEAFLPLLLAAASMPALALVEWQRRRHRVTFTNLRIVQRTGLLRTRESQVRFDAIIDLDERRGLLGSWLDHGSLLPVTRDDETFWVLGLRPFSEHHARLDALIQATTNTESLARMRAKAS